MFVACRERYSETSIKVLQMAEFGSMKRGCSEERGSSHGRISLWMAIWHFFDRAGYCRELIQFLPVASLASIAMVFTLSCMHWNCFVELNGVDEKHTAEQESFGATDSALPSLEFDEEAGQETDELLRLFEPLPEFQCISNADQSHLCRMTFCAFLQDSCDEGRQPSAAGFRVAPKPVELLPAESSGQVGVDESGLFPISLNRLERAGSVVQTMEFSMLYSTVYWGRIRVEGTPASAKVPEQILRKMGKGKAKLPRTDITKFLATVIPEAAVNLPHGIVVLTPAAFEQSLLPPDEEAKLFPENTVLLRFQEICLPDRDDVDPRHIHRSVFLAVDWKHNTTLDEILQQLSSSDSSSRRHAQAELQAAESTAYVVGELRSRILFIK